MAVQFGATFAGVLASFVLWFGSRWLIQRRANGKAVEHLLSEMEEEIQYNIAVLQAVINTASKSLEEMRYMPSFIPRMSLQTYQYAVMSGDLRLLNNLDRQRLLKFAAYHCKSFNTFADAADRWLAVFLVRNDEQALVNSIECLKGLRANATKTREQLTHSLGELRKDTPTVWPRGPDGD